MGATELPALLEEPVWFEPLSHPSWLLPPIREGAPRVLFVPTGGAPDDDLRLGVPLFLGEALRFSTDARVDVATGDWAVPAGSAAVVRIQRDGAGLSIRITDADGGAIDLLEVPAPDDPAFAQELATLPSRLVAALGPAGVHAVWATVFQAPSAGAALAYTRSHGVLARLREDASHADDGRGGSAPFTTGLTHLAQAVSVHASPLGVAAFVAGLAVVKAAGVPTWGDFRLQANAIAQRATDPADPIFRLSVASLTLFGDTGEAGSRAQRLARGADDELRGWLARVRAVG